MENPVFIVVALCILVFGALSRKAERSVFTPPIFFVAVGFLVSWLGAAHLDVPESVVHTLAEITLVLVLFTDASRIRLKQLRSDHSLPVRLLLVGLPLTVVFGALAAVGLFPHFTFWEAALLAAVLAPTDAALGQAVVSSEAVPVRIRQTLNVESGLNDGIALPVVLVFLSACASNIAGLGGAEYWLRFAFLQVTLGPLAGWLVGWAGAKLVDVAARREWMNETFQHLSALGIALLAYASASVVGGNGFIAAFVAGLVLGNAVSEEIGERIHEFGETEGQLLTLLVFLVFGAVLLPELVHAPPSTWIYAILSLTVVRMVPVALSLLGAGVRPQTVAFLGWFGPRGIASILFGLLVIADSQLAAQEEIFAVVVATVLLSVIAHGMTAYPLSKRYGLSMADGPGDAPEHAPVSEMPLRIRGMD